VNDVVYKGKSITKEKGVGETQNGSHRLYAQHWQRKSSGRALTSSRIGKGGKAPYSDKTRADQGQACYQSPLFLLHIRHVIKRRYFNTAQVLILRIGTQQVLEHLGREQAQVLIMSHDLIERFKHGPHISKIILLDKIKSLEE
jgi:hypothetical protein